MATLEEPVEIDKNMSPVDYLMERMRDPQTDRLNARDRIAMALLPFFAPKLMATAQIQMGQDSSWIGRCCVVVVSSWLRQQDLSAEYDRPIS
jgi:hypothetical protein